MTLVKFLYLLPYLFAFALSLMILIFTWSRWRVNAAVEFGWFLFGQNLWLIGFILGLLANSITAKVIWHKVEWSAAIISAAALPFFVSRYLNLKPKRFKLVSGLFLAIPAGMFAFMVADHFYPMMYRGMSLVQGEIFSELQRVDNWPADLMAVICGLIALVSIAFLVYRGLRGKSIFRSQTLLMSLGVTLPIIGVVMSYMDIQIIPGRDAGPLMAVIGDLIIVWGLFRFHLFNIVPIAREAILQEMDDLVMVLDAQDRIVIINKQALSELRLELKEVLGRSAFDVLARYPYLLDEFRTPKNATSEVIFDGERGYFHFDIKSTLLKDKLGNYQGRIFVARDVTSYAQLQYKLKDLNENLEKRVVEQTKQLAESYETTLEGWARALELRDKETEGHSRRVTEKTVELARAYGINEGEIDHIRRGAILHDIGKMAIPDEILRAKKNLTKDDWEIIKRHPVTAYELLKKIPYLQPAIDIPYCHHEHWNGSGYPRGLKGKDIPIAARLFSVVDVWDALLSDRTYSHAWKREDVIQYIKDKSGKEFDPAVVDIFLKMEG